MACYFLLFGTIIEKKWVGLLLSRRGGGGVEGWEGGKSRWVAYFLLLGTIIEKKLVGLLVSWGVERGQELTGCYFLLFRTIIEKTLVGLLLSREGVGGGVEGGKSRWMLFVCLFVWNHHQKEVSGTVAQWKWRKVWLEGGKSSGMLFLIVWNHHQKEVRRKTNAVVLSSAASFATIA